jgi:GNAT superfamily N-acetyltransferase
MSVKRAVVEDIPELSALLSVLFAQEREFRPDDDAQRRGLARIIEQPATGDILVLRVGGAVRGMVNLLYTVSTALGERVALLEDMIVSPLARGTGAGTQLLRAAIETARQNGCRRITLLTDGDNTAAQRFYARQGFEISAMVAMKLRLE